MQHQLQRLFLIEVTELQWNTIWMCEFGQDRFSHGNFCWTVGYKCQLMADFYQSRYACLSQLVEVLLQFRYAVCHTESCNGLLKFLNCLFGHVASCQKWSAVKPLTLNDNYSGLTAPLTSKRCILYIYSTNIGIEYFKHGIYSSFFYLQNAVCFIILTYLVPVLFTFYIQVC